MKVKVIEAVTIVAKKGSIVEIDEEHLKVLGDKVKVVKEKEAK